VRPASSSCSPTSVSPAIPGRGRLEVHLLFLFVCHCTLLPVSWYGPCRLGFAAEPTWSVRGCGGQCRWHARAVALGQCRRHGRSLICLMMSLYVMHTLRPFSFRKTIPEILYKYTYTCTHHSSPKSFLR
jgi:hypothetical protein